MTQQREKKAGKGSLTQTLNIGLDGKYRKSIFRTASISLPANGSWSDEMELEVRYQEALGAAMIRVTFDETNLKLSVRSQMPEELDITKRVVQTLTGRLENS